ncbi:MAG: M20 aminoacylase family protein [Acidimicrobiia bacterium]|nr:MAG: M20 aminoacylase family protein [Acidimicrobiia bacterium]
MPAHASALRTSWFHDEMTAWRRAIHESPEVRFDVSGTAAKVASLLVSFGVDVETGVGRTGVVGVLRRGNGKHSIGLRADMDALPIETHSTTEYRSRVDGRHHGCGHDGHTAMLLGAARELALNGDFDGTVHFIFQPNEEEGLGAQAMIDDGLFERWSIDEVYGMHCVPGVPAGHFALRSGPMMAFEDDFVIHIRGRGGHASAPNMTFDPMVPAAELVVALQTVVSRSLSPMDGGVVSVTEFVTDGSRNVLPSTVTIRGDARGFTAVVRETIERRIGEIVEGVCLAHGLDYSVDYSHEFDVTMNTPTETSHVAGAACSVVTEAAVDSNCAPNPASEDFARMLEQRPGCYVFIGNGTSGANGLPWHNPAFDFNDAILPTGADYWVALTEGRLGHVDGPAVS